MRRFLVIVVVLAASCATGAAEARASAACEVTQRATRVWETDPSHVAYRVGDRLYGCRSGEVTPVGSAAGVERVTVNGYGLGLLRRTGPGRCRTAEAFDLRAGERVNRAVVGCRRRVLRLRVTSAGVLALQQTAAHGRTRIEEVARGRRQVLDPRARSRAMFQPGLGLVTWFSRSGRRTAKLGRAGCLRRNPGHVLESGDSSVWTESEGEDVIYGTDVTEFVYSCDRRTGIVLLVDLEAGTGCAQPRPVALRPSWVAIVDTQASTHCSDDQYAVRVVGLSGGGTTVKAKWSSFSEPFPVLITTTGNLVFADPGTYISHDKQVLYATRTGTLVLDPGPDVDPASLTLTGDVASWTSSGTPRSAQTP